MLLCPRLSKSHAIFVTGPARLFPILFLTSFEEVHVVFTNHKILKHVSRSSNDPIHVKLKPFHEHVKINMNN